MQAVGNGYTGVLPIDRTTRKAMVWAGRNFQLYRRSRYVEFNLVWDGAPCFGLQAGGALDPI